MVKERGLGRGLDALLSSRTDITSAIDADLKQLPIDLLQRGRYQPRVDVHQEALSDLAESIRAQGVIQPIVVRPVTGDRYEIIAGERRWRAAQMAGLQAIPAIVREIPDEAAVAVALIENIQREGLSPLEEATALQRLIKEFGMTHQETGDAVGRSRTAVSNLLRLLELHPTVKSMLQTGELEMGHARALLSLTGEQQAIVAKKIAARGMSVRATEIYVKSLQKPAIEKPPHLVAKNPDVAHLESSLTEKLSARVSISANPSGKGRLQIRFNSLDELEGILEHIR